MVLEPGRSRNPVKTGPKIGRASSSASALEKRSRARALLVYMLAPTPYGRQRHDNAPTILTFLAVSLIGSTAWPESTICSALRSHNGPRAAAAPTAHIHVDPTPGTPLTLTSRFLYDEEPLVPSGSGIVCATELQPLGSGSHSTSIPVHSDYEGNHSKLLHATTLQTPTSYLRCDAEPQPNGVHKLMCTALGTLPRRSGFQRSLSSCPVRAASLRTHVGSGTFNGILRLSMQHCMPRQQAAGVVLRAVFPSQLDAYASNWMWFNGLFRGVWAQ